MTTTAATPYIAPIPNARWALDSLLHRLEGAGWGELDGRAHQGIRSTLRALAGVLGKGKRYQAEGHATAHQIAVRAGLSDKWVTRCLHWLEDAEVITWDRGGITSGIASRRARQKDTIPGRFRVNKKQLVALIFAAEPWDDERQRAYRAELLERVRYVRTKFRRGRNGVWTKNRRPDEHKRRSEHVELSGDLPPLQGDTFGGSPTENDTSDPSGAPSAPSSPAPTARGPIPEELQDLSGAQLARAALVARLTEVGQGDAHQRARWRAKGLLS